jgi:hypothetical protein
MILRSFNVSVSTTHIRSKHNHSMNLLSLSPSRNIHRRESLTMAMKCQLLLQGVL